MICGKNACMAECRVKDAGQEVVNGVEYEKRTYYCPKHGDTHSILRKEGFEDIKID